MVIKKSTILSAVLSCLPVISYASSVFMNGTDCRSILGGGDSFACFVNVTGNTLKGFYLMERVEFNDGSTEEYPYFYMGCDFEPGHFAGFSMENEVFKSNKIKSIEYTLVAGDKKSPKILPGCVMTFRGNFPRWTYVNVTNGPNGPHC